MVLIVAYCVLRICVASRLHIELSEFILKNYAFPF